MYRPQITVLDIESECTSYNIGSHTLTTVHIRLAVSNQGKIYKKQKRHTQQATTLARIRFG